MTTKELLDDIRHFALSNHTSLLLQYRDLDRELRGYLSGSLRITNFGFLAGHNLGCPAVALQSLCEVFSLEVVDRVACALD